VHDFQREQRISGKAPVETGTFEGDPIKSPHLVEKKLLRPKRQPESGLSPKKGMGGDKEENQT
jgi:hypothetical protein